MYVAQCICFIWCPVIIPNTIPLQGKMCFLWGLQIDELLTYWFVKPLCWGRFWKNWQKVTQSTQSKGVFLPTKAFLCVYSVRASRADSDWSNSMTLSVLSEEACLRAFDLETEELHCKRKWLLLFCGLNASSLPSTHIIKFVKQFSIRYVNII